MEEISFIAGDYGTKLASSVITMDTPDRVSIAGLHNKRFIYIEEPPKRSTIDGERLKDWTG